MLSKKLIQQLKNIPEPRRKQYLFLAQNPVLREMFFAVETADKMHAIGVKYHFPQEKITCLAKTTGRVILGEVKYSEFVQALQESCGLIPESAQSIADDVTRLIFAPIADELKKVHGYEIPEHLKQVPGDRALARDNATESLAKARTPDKPRWTPQDLKAEIEKNKQELSEPEITAPENLPTLQKMQTPEKIKPSFTQKTQQTYDIYREPITQQDQAITKPKLNENIVDLKNRAY